MNLSRSVSGSPRPGSPRPSAASGTDHRPPPAPAGTHAPPRRPHRPGSVSDQPGTLSPTYRGRVAKLSLTYRSHPVSVNSGETGRAQFVAAVTGGAGSLMKAVW